MSAKATVRPVALVTGGNRGIGRASVLALARRGYDVVFVDCEDTDDTLQTSAQAGALGAHAAFVQGDIAEVAGHDKIVDVAWRMGGPVCALVNNAATSVSTRGDLLDADIADYDRVMAVNLRGTFFFTQAIARRMVADGHSSLPRAIVTVTSISADAASPERAAYCITKSALSMMVKLFAVRLAAEGIASHEVRPGVIRTNMTRPVSGKYDALFAEGLAPIARWGEADEVGAVVALLCSGDLPYATGNVIHVDGGLHVARL